MLIEVADEGLGIPGADVNYLFTAFFRTESATAAAIPGTGLGLAVSKAIVEAHGGTISVASDEGAGTIFTVALRSAVEATDRKPIAA